MANVVNTKQFNPMSEVYDVTLSGEDLWCKFGFGDGNLIDEHAWEVPEIEKFDDMLHDLPRDKGHTTIFNRVCTMALVELYLLPKFDRSLTLYFANYSHNGVRVEEDAWWENADWKVEKQQRDALPSVVVKGVHVLEIMWAMKCVFEEWLEDRPMIFPSALSQTANVIANELKCKVVIDNQLEFICSPSPPKITQDMSPR